MTSIQKKKKIINFLLVLIFLPIIIYVGKQVYKSYNINNNGILTNATITDKHIKKVLFKLSYRDEYYLLVRYSSGNKQIHTNELYVTQGFYTKYKIGDTITILYIPGKPTNISLPSTGSL